MIEISKLLKYRCGIYMLSIKNHRYVGSSVNLYNRLHRHVNDLKRKDHDNEYLQRAVDKYGIENLSYRILEICNPNIEYIDLLKREKYFIEEMKSDLNLKLDPVTQQECITTITPVYQFNQFGELVKRWNSMVEAARSVKIHSSNITVACRRPQRQRLAAGYLWSYEPEYPYDLQVLYVYDLEGKFLSKHINTVDIYETYFKESGRKTVLSQLKKKIDSNSPYKTIYIYSSQQFTGRIYDMKILSLLKKLKEMNPTIINCTESGKVVSSIKFNNYRNKHRVIKRLIKFNINSQHIPNEIFLNLSFDKFKKTLAKNVKTGEEFSYSSVVKAAVELFNNKEEDKNIRKHLKRNTPYKGYLFKWDC